MLCSRISCRSVGLAALLCFVMAGCGVSYPYYTIDGSPEGRVVVIHLSEDEKVKVPAGTGMGGMPDDARAMLASGQDATIEQDGAKVTMMTKGPTIQVRKVEYNGEVVLYHEPIF